MDFEKELDKLSGQLENEAFGISLPARAVATRALYEVDSRYGENSDHPLEYHNAHHALDVIKRGVHLTSLLTPYIAGDYRRSMYDLVTVGGAIHDSERGMGDGYNEKLSAEYGEQLIQSNGYSREINTKRFMRTLREGVLATQVEREDSGKVQQINLRQGSHDPFKFILASADINGIAMEGPKRMVRDATNLCYELHDGNPSADELYNFIILQPKFLRDRLQDDQIKPDIEYYFKDQSESVYDVVSREFGGTIKTAYSKALELASLPLIHRIVSDKLEKSSHIVGSKLIQNAIAEALKI